MTNHLSSEQISMWIAGDATAEQRQHVHECEECGGEIARLQTALGNFRGAVSLWAERENAAPGIQCVAAPRRPQRLFRRWAAAVAAAGVLAVIPLYRNLEERARQAEAEQAARNAQDALLMERINFQLSRTAPASFEPLVNLVSA